VGGRGHGGEGGATAGGGGGGGAVATKTNKPVPDKITGSDDDRLIVINEGKRAWKEATVT